MRERILRRTTTTIEEYLGAPCPPCATSRADLAASPDGAPEASAQADACSPATDDAPEANAACAPSHKFAHLIGRSFSFGDDNDDLEGASCPRPMGSTEDDGASCPRPGAEDGE